MSQCHNIKETQSYHIEDYKNLPSPAPTSCLVLSYVCRYLLPEKTPQLHIKDRNWISDFKFEWSKLHIMSKKK